ncbi:hypothetical protein H2O64_11400 [Kordia sp. YSTF-M3]|uniref:Uncharacterized protein n=1 Tax=Kordia aestuariivivens TaxID=2759037 RepID=A0ABR7Q9R1_9FLAO|nr:hypothetical protein [Kordia aestuariivivens]MBC8755283.1 hypothetical protein [Kordia aestuariivivens]
MKKQLKKLSLSKKVISNFTDINGGIEPPSRRRTCKETCQDEPVSGSCYIESNCPGCTLF